MSEAIMVRRVGWHTSLLVLLISFSVATIATAQETPKQEALRLQKEAQTFLDSGRYQDGIGMAKRALTIQERDLGNEHLDVAASLQVLGRLHEGAGNYDLARSAHQRALDIREKLLGPKHRYTAVSLADLADTYVSSKKYSIAEPLYQRALAIFDKASNAENVDISRILIALANIYMERDSAHDRAESFLKRALAIRERVSGPDSYNTAQVLNNLGSVYFSMGAYARAKILYQRALAILEKVRGPEHPETTFALANLAILHSEAGAYAEAEAMYERALAIQERTVGIEQPVYAKMLSLLARMYSDTGAYDRAESLFNRAISIQEKTQGSETAEMAVLLKKVADMYLQMSRYSEAKLLYQRALDIAEKTLGVDHYFTAEIVGELGDTYRQMGTYDKAGPLLKRAMSATEATEGPKHWYTAHAFYRLANLYFDIGKHGESQQLHQRAVAIYEQALGLEHPRTARALRSLALVHWVRGERQRTLSFLQRAQRIQTRNSERFLSGGSEIRKYNYARTLTNNTFEDVSFAMSTREAGAAVLGLTSVLQHKGRVLDSMSDNVARIRRSVAATDQVLLDGLADIAGQLSTLTYGDGGNMSPEQYRRRFTQLAKRQEQLEGELATRSRAFSRELTPVTVANVRRAIPVDAALVELFRYTPFDPTKSIKARRGAPRYVAYVLKRSGAPVAIDIGEAQAIEALARRLRVTLANPASNDVKQHSAALFAKLLAPLRVHLRGVEHLLLSPDGELNLVPMAALMDESGAYFGERVEVSYLTSGRDLLRFDAEPSTIAETVVVGNPDYGRRAAVMPGDKPSLQPQRSADLDRGGLLFRPLGGTALEAQDLKALLQLNDANLLLGRNASEGNLKRLKAPRILHIASHGFFLSDQRLAGEISKRRSSGSAPPTSIENPLLRSGIALAGANERSSGKDDGILTALEATQLDLSRTALVVLSACDTGVGEVQNGEGVYGLRRALALAGAQTQVTSLWRVPDDATRTLMVDYYRRLLQGDGRSSALRRAQRAMSANPAFSHPYYWASFMPIGDWSPLPSHSGSRPAR
jgi:CHAT domain-containing protein